MPHSLHRRTKRLEIRPHRASDYEAWRHAYLALPPPKNRWDRKPRPAEELTRAKYRELLQAQEAKRKADTYYDLGVFRKSDGALVGLVSLMEVARGISQTAYLGYGLLNPYWGQGYAQEAVHAILDIGFKDLKLHRIEAGIEPENARSVALAKSLGMRYEGRKKRCLHLRGKWVDLLMYTLTCEDLGLKFRGSTSSSRRT